jgi:hypothetical protein
VRREDSRRECVERPRKSGPEEMLMSREEKWAEEGRAASWHMILLPRDFRSCRVGGWYFPVLGSVTTGA